MHSLERTGEVEAPRADLPVREDGMSAEEMKHALAHTGLLLREARCANKRLRELNTAKSQSLSLSSHELRTPLAVIKSFAEILVNDEDSLDREKSLQFMRIINQECDRLGGLLDGLLKLQRIESGTAHEEVGPVDPKRIAEHLRGTFGPAAKEKGIELVFDLPAGLPVFDASREQMIMALSNLVTNAIAYNPSGTRVSVSTEARGSSVRFSVSDDGVGIDAEHHSFLFDRFFRVRNKTAALTRGTGLGLAIVKAIAEYHGGRTLMESTLGLGSTFSIEVPVSSKDGAFNRDVERALSDAREMGHPLGIIFMRVEAPGGSARSAGDVSCILPRMEQCVESVVRCTDMVLQYRDDALVVLLRTNDPGTRRCMERIQEALECGRGGVVLDEGAFSLWFGTAVYPDSACEALELVSVAEKGRAKWQPVHLAGMAAR